MVYIDKGDTIRYPGGGGGLEFFSRANDLFQPGSAARWKFHILLHVYIEQLLKWLFYFTQESARNYLFQKKNSSPPPPRKLDGGPLTTMVDQ